MRKKFTLNSLKDSESFYSPIEIKLFYALLHYSKDSTDPNMQRLYSTLQQGMSEWDILISNIVTLNIGFIKLLELAELRAALPLVRLQTDNLKHLYAESKYFNKVLYKIFEKGLVLNQIKVKGKAINSTELLNELDERYGDVMRIWKYYNGYVHPSKVDGEDLYTYYSCKDDKEIVPTRLIKNFSKDMIYINQLIVNILVEVIDKAEGHKTKI